MAALETVAACVAALSEATQALTGVLADKRNPVPEVVEALRLVGRVQGSVLKLEQDLRNLAGGEDLGTIKARLERLSRENAELRAELQQHLDVFYDRNAYWRARGEDAPEGPFCSNCLDTRRQLVRMNDRPQSDYAECPTCKKPVKVFEGRRPPRGPLFEVL